MQIANLPNALTASNVIQSLAAEACLMTEKWEMLRSYTASESQVFGGNFASSLGSLLLDLKDRKDDAFKSALKVLRNSVIKSMSFTSTVSLQACHEAMLQLHALTEIETIAGVHSVAETPPLDQSVDLSRRLDILGPYSADKQYLLGLRRATMHLSRYEEPSQIK